MTQKTINYRGVDFESNKAYADLARAMSIVNRRHYDQVNGKGVAQTYICEVELIGASTDLGIYTAPESWTVKNAIKRLHIARQKSLEKAGVKLASLPSYSRHVKMFLDMGHRACRNDDNSIRPALYSPATNQTGGVTITTASDSAWLYTQLAHATGVEGDLLTSSGGDGYELTLMGGHDFQASTGNLQTYDSVAVVEAYLEHRRNRTVNLSPSTGDVIQEEPNPLALLMNDSLSGQEKMDQVKTAQLVDPPYQTASGSWAGTDALDLHLASFMFTSAQAIRDRDVIRIPAGLAMLQSSTGIGTATVRFHVMDIVDMEG